MNRNSGPQGPFPSGASLTPGVLTARDAHWPELWLPLPDPPETVEYLGDPTALNLPCLALVGTRKCSPRGEAVAGRLARELAASGWVVVSGLATGIDAAAHRGALAVGGRSIGVMATGIDRVYPQVHLRLRNELAASGCVLTEYPAGTPPLKHHFPRRNRLIAGLSRAVIVIEAPARSGALLTAMLGLDYDREIFAVPGPVDLETSRGCHHLLREGAHLLEGAADVERVLGCPQPTAGPATAASAPEGPCPGSAARWILDRVDLEGVPRDELRARWPGSEAAWCEGLLALELAGLIRRLPAGKLARTIWR